MESHLDQAGVFNVLSGVADGIFHGFEVADGASKGLSFSSGGALRGRAWVLEAACASGANTRHVRGADSDLLCSSAVGGNRGGRVGGGEVGSPGTSATADRRTCTSSTIRAFGRETHVGVGTRRWLQVGIWGLGSKAWYLRFAACHRSRTREWLCVAVSSLLVTGGSLIPLHGAGASPRLWHHTTPALPFQGLGLLLHLVYLCIFLYIHIVTGGNTKAWTPTAGRWTVDAPMPQILEGTVEVVKLVPTERVQRLIDASPIPQIMEEIVEVELAPQARVQRIDEQIVEEPFFANYGRTR